MRVPAIDTRRLRSTWIVAITLACTLLVASSASAEKIFWDGFNVSTNQSGLINFEIGNPRQGGPLVPVSWVANASDYHVQLFGSDPRPLMLAGDANAPAAAPTMASPDLNFSGAGTVSPDVIGKRITFDVDVGVFVQDATGGSYLSAGITIGAPSTLVEVKDAVTPHFGILFIEDTFSGEGNFIQFWDHTGLIQNVLPHTAGAGPMFVEILVDDPTDGDPWNGVGETHIDVYVNGSVVGFPVVYGSGGLTSNYITLQGDRDFNGNDLSTNVFDNLLVYALSTCGDNVIEGTETCDDGNVVSLDGCSDVCDLEVCGDGFVHSGQGEECDDGNTTAGDGCSDTCIIEFCGDNVTQAGIGEECDDGNLTNGDGCSDACLSEYGPPVPLLDGWMSMLMAMALMALGATWMLERHGDTV